MEKIVEKETLSNGTQNDSLKKKAYGTCQQDPKWTYEEGGQENSQAKTWEVEGCCQGLRAFRMNKDGSGGASSAMDGTTANHLVGERRGSAALRGVAALQVERVQQGDGEQGMQPWMLEQYQHPPRQGSINAWEVGLVREGWLIRHHKKSRKRLFIPLHQSLPIDPTRLSTERITVRVLATGDRIVTLDDWRMSKRTADDREWRGYTFFKLIDEENIVASSSSRPTSTNELGEDRTSQGMTGDRRTKTMKKEKGHHSQDSSYEGVWSAGRRMVKESKDRLGSI